MYCALKTPTARNIIVPSEHLGTRKTLSWAPSLRNALPTNQSRGGGKKMSRRRSEHCPRNWKAHEIINITSRIFQAKPIFLRRGGCGLSTREIRHRCSLCSEAGNVIKEIGSKKSAQQRSAFRSRHNNTRRRQPWQLNTGRDGGSPMFLFLLL